MTGTDYFVGAGVLLWIGLHLMHRSEIRRVHGTCTRPKTGMCTHCGKGIFVGTQSCSAGRIAGQIGKDCYE